MMCAFAICVGTSSCKDDKDKEPYIELKVSTDQIPLLSSKNATSSFTVTSTDSWTVVNNSPEWLFVSPISGNGNGTVTVQALQENSSSQERIATLTISTGDEETQKTVTITQMAAFIGNCNVTFSNPLALATSIAYECAVDSKAATVYSAYLNSAAAGWTNDKIVQTLTEMKPQRAKDFVGVGTADNLEPSTTYYLCAVAFDENGNRGDLTKTPVTTMALKNTDPWVYISDPTFDSSYWHWSTNPDAYTPKYYMIAVQGNDAISLALSSEAIVAWLMKESIDKGKSDPIARGDNWYIEKDANTNNLFLATWGKDVDDKFSSRLNRGAWIINSASRPAKAPEFKGKAIRKNHISQDQMEKLRESIKFFK